MRTATLARRAAGTLALALTLGATAAAPAAATLNQSWNGWKWSRTGNLEIKVGNNLSAQWQPYFANAVAQWNADPIIDFVAVAGNGSTGTTCNARYGMIQICNGNFGFNGWLGYAYVWTSGGRIVQATVKMNDSYFAAAKYNTDAWRAMTMCHELGHTLGLNHADNTRTNANIGSCLDLSNDPAGTGTLGPFTSMQPGANDFQWLKTIYADVDGSQLASTRPSLIASSALAVPEAQSWAMLIAGFGMIGFAQRRRPRVVAA